MFLTLKISRLLNIAFNIFLSVFICYQDSFKNAQEGISREFLSQKFLPHPSVTCLITPFFSFVRHFESHWLVRNLYHQRLRGIGMSNYWRSNSYVKITLTARSLVRQNHSNGYVPWLEIRLVCSRRWGKPRLMFPGCTIFQSKMSGIALTHDVTSCGRFYV